MDRMEKLNSLLREELAKLIADEAEELGIIDVVAVSASRDLSQAEVLVTSVTLTQSGNDFLKKLESRAGNYRHILGKRLNLKKIPAFLFRLDTKGAEADRLLELLDQVEKGH